MDLTLFAILCVVYIVSIEIQMYINASNRRLILHLSDRINNLQKQLNEIRSTSS